MSNIERKPKIRFPEFTDAWEQCKLDEFGESFGGTSLESGFSEEGEFKVISIGSFSENNQYRDQGIRIGRNEKSLSRILNKNDLVMILNDKTQSGNIIGRVLLINRDNTYVYNQRTQRIVLNQKKYDPCFIYQMLNADDIRKKIIKSAQGNTQIYVNWAQIKQLEYMVPSTLKEQRSIGDYFCKLDNLITLHQRKLEILKNLKKSFLQKLFPQKDNKVPELRFPGFSGDWEQRELKKIVDKAVDNRGKTPSFYSSGRHPLIEVASLGSCKPDYSKVSKYLDDNAFDNELRAHVEENDILFSTVGNVGLVSLMDNHLEACIAQNIVAFRAKENIDAKYLYALFSNKENQKKVQRIVMGAVQPSIKVSQLVNEVYTISPNNEEQMKIGSYFEQLDNLITLHQRKLEILQNIKKGFLQQMFV